MCSKDQKRGADLILRKVVFLSQDLVQGPKAHLLDMAQLPMPGEVVFGILARAADPLWHAPQQLYEQSQVVLIPVCQRLR